MKFIYFHFVRSFKYPLIATRYNLEKNIEAVTVNKNQELSVTYGIGGEW